MAEIFGEYDPPSPCITTFCPRVSLQQFDKLASENTGKALEELVAYLEYNPTAYYDILRKRRKEQLESGGVFSYLKTKIVSSVRGEDHAIKFDISESRMRLSNLKEEMKDAFDYSQESRGLERRFSKRIAAKMTSKVFTSTPNSSPVQDEVSQERTPHKESTPVLNCNVESLSVEGNSASVKPCSEESFLSSLHLPSKPKMINARQRDVCDHTFSLPLPPPPPPPPPPLLHQHPKGNMASSAKEIHPRTNKKSMGKTKTRSKNRVMETDMVSADKENQFTQLLTCIKKGTVKLKPISKDDDDTPEKASRKRRKDNSKEDSTYSLFNQQLVDKFRNAKSPNVSILSLSDFSPDNSFSV